MKSKRTTLRCVLANGPGSETVVGKSQRWPHSSLGDATRCCGRCWSVLLRGDRGDSGWPSAMDSERDRCFGLSALPASVTHRGLCLTLYLPHQAWLPWFVWMSTRKKTPLLSSPSMALALCCGVSKGSPSLLSQQRPTKKQKGVLKLSKKKTTPHPAQTRPVSEASVRVQRFSLCDSISEVSLLVATELFSSHKGRGSTPTLKTQ